jgi:hypothetical protein
MPNGSQVGGGVNLLGVAYLVLVLLAVFFPLLLRRRGSPPGESDTGSDGGGGGPPGPRVPPNSPPPGIPLDDAEPAAMRLRGPGRLADAAAAPARRPSHPGKRRERTPRRLGRRTHTRPGASEVQSPNRKPDGRTTPLREHVSEC